MKRVHYRGLSKRHILNQMQTQLPNTTESESAVEDSVPKYRPYSAQDVVDELLPSRGSFACFVGKAALKYKSIICKVPFLYNFAVKYKKQLIQQTQAPKDLSGLLAYEQKDFIVACYKEILNRQPDTEGFFAYQESLCSGMPKEAVIEAFLSSDEFKNNFLVLNRKQYQKVYKSYKLKRALKKTPILGYLILWAQLPKRMEQLAFEYRVTEWNTRNTLEDYNYLNRELITSLHQKADGIIREKVSNEAIKCKFEHIENKIDKLEEAFTCDSQFGLIENKIDKLEEAFACDSRLELIRNKIDQLEKSLNFVIDLQHSLEKETYSLSADYKATASAVQNELLALHTLQSNTMDVVSNSTVDQQQQYNAQVLVSISEKSDYLGMQINTIESQLNEIKTKCKSVFASYPGGILAVQTQYFIMGLPSEEWRLASYLSLNGYFESGSEKLFRRVVKSTDTVIDVGANLGIYTLHAASLGCKVVSFEPTPDTFRLLNENIRVNGFFESGQIETFNLAVGEKNKDAEISIVSNISGWNNIFDKETQNKVPIKVVALDNMFESSAKIDIVKIDVEGGELFVLHGMKRILAQNAHIKMLVEFAPDHLRRAETEPAALLDEIRNLGFTIQAINEETGETEFMTDEKLIESPSINLFLSRRE